MAELHIFGQILGARGFDGSNLFCKWKLIFGDGWTLVEGCKEGQTQVDRHRWEEDRAVWSHPIDVHLTTRGIQDWPRLVLEVWRQDTYGRSDLSGYASCHLPSSPGHHLLQCATWRPLGSLSEETSRHFLGGSLRLADPDGACGRPCDRFRLRARSCGTVHLDVYVVQRDFDKYGIET
ncbi:putative B9 domain-containing protein [Ixodes scapularis]